LTEQCWQTYWRTGDSFRDVYELNKNTPTQIFINALYEFIPVLRDVVVMKADIIFKNWLSFAFYLGDIFYRLVVLDHTINWFQ
jgi:hypothetical protein